MKTNNMRIPPHFVIACIVVLSTMGCMRAEKIDAERFMDLYNQEQTDHSHTVYKGQRGKYHYLDVYGRGHGTWIQRQERVKTLADNLPQPFPSRPQKVKQPSRCFPDLGLDASVAPFDTRECMNSQSQLSDCEIGAIIVKAAESQDLPLFLYVEKGSQKLGSCWWVRFQRFSVYPSIVSPSFVDALVASDRKVIFSGLEQLPKASVIRASSDEPKPDSRRDERR